jgi:hypothetical protein
MSNWVISGIRKLEKKEKKAWEDAPMSMSVAARDGRRL